MNRMTLSEALRLWRAHGGDSFGPHVEHVSMKQSEFLGFCHDLISREAANPESTIEEVAANAGSDAELRLDPAALDVACEKCWPHTWGEGTEQDRQTCRDDLGSLITAYLAAALRSDQQQAADGVKPVGYVTEAALKLIREAKPGWHYHMFTPDQADPLAVVALYVHPIPDRGEVEALTEDETLVDAFHAELKKQQAFSIEHHGKITLAMYPFIKLVADRLSSGDTRS